MSEPLHPEVAILNAAIDLPESERAAYLQRVCADDDTLQRRIEELIRAHEKSTDFLDTPVTKPDLALASVSIHFPEVSEVTRGIKYFISLNAGSR